MRILWDDSLGGEFASDFTVTAYNGIAQTAQIVVVDNRTSETNVNIELNEYDKIKILVTKWCLPNRRIRINNFLLGSGITFEKGNLISFSHEMIVDTFGEELPKNEISFTIDNRDRTFDIVEKTGISKYIMSRQQVTTFYGLRKDDKSIEWINGGKFYLSEWSAKYGSFSADFKARDKLVQMLSIFDDDDTDTTLLAKFQRVLNASILQADEYVLNIGNQGDVSVGYFPKDTKFSDALKYLAQAACIAFWISRDGVFHFEQLDDTVEDYIIGFDSMFDYPNVEKTSLIKEITVKVYTYTSPTESTSYPYIYTVTGNPADRSMSIDNPLITSLQGANNLITYILMNQLDTFTVSTNYRSDPRLDGGDILVMDMAGETYNMVTRTLKYNYTGAWKGQIKTGITNPTPNLPTNDIEITPEAMTIDLTAFGTDTEKPSMSFNISAEMIPSGVKYISWGYSCTPTNKPINFGFSYNERDTIQLISSNRGRDLTVNITGNHKWLSNGHPDFNKYTYTSKYLQLIATSSDGYQEIYNVNTLVNQYPV